jgi:hypothetical protein
MIRTKAPLGEAALARLGGQLCLWAGLLGAASGLALAVIPPGVHPSRYSYPLSASAFAAVQGWFFVQHLGLIVGLVGMRNAGAVGRRRRGFVVAMTGMGLLTIMELLAISAARSVMPSRRTELLDSGYGLACAVSGIGLAVMGIEALRFGAWRGWRRYLPLALGIYVFVPMFPAIFSGFVAARLGIAGWMLSFAALGWVLTRSSRDVASPPG